MSLCGGKRQNYRLYGLQEVGFGSCMVFQGKAFKYSDKDNVKTIKRINCATRRSHCPTKDSLIVFICDGSE